MKEYVVLWITQNNFVEFLTGKVAETVRLSGRELRDFSWLPDVPLPKYPEVAHLKPFLYGSTATARYASLDPEYAPHTWFNAHNMDQLTWGEHRQGEMLNHIGDVVTLGEFAKLVGSKPHFVRPLRDMKALIACVVTPDGHEAWRARQNERNPSLTDQSLVWVASVKEIISEYRFIVGDHEILAGSSYRLNGAGHRSTDIPARILSAAKELAKGWQPARLCVMDVCETADGRISIVEFNCIHSAGRYAITPLQFIEVIEDFSKTL